MTRESLTVATSFTADPLEPTLRFWLDELGIDARAEFAPYNQVLRQLLDPVSALGRNATGVNIIIVRLEDWTRFRADNSPEAVVLEQGVDELADAIREFAGRAGRPLIVSVCPPSSRVSRDTERSELHISMITRLREEIAGIGAVSWLEPGLLGLDAPVRANPKTPVAMRSATCRTPRSRTRRSRQLCAAHRRSQVAPFQGDCYRLRQHALEGSRRGRRSLRRNLPSGSPRASTVRGRFTRVGPSALSPQQER